MGIKGIFRKGAKPKATIGPPVSGELLGSMGDLQRRFTLQEGYHLACDTYAGRVKEAFGDSLPRIDNGVILDWGCFTGYTTEEIAAMYPSSRVIGGDISHKAIEEAKINRKGVEFLVMDGFKPPFPNGTLDGVFCMNNIYQAFVNMTMDSAGEKLSGIGRLVREVGYLLIAGEREPRVYDSIVLQKQDTLFVPISIQFGKGIKSDKNLEIIARTLAPGLNQYLKQPIAGYKG